MSRCHSMTRAAAQMTNQTQTSAEALLASASRGTLDDYLTPDQQADELDISTRTLARWRGKRMGPPYTTVGRKLRYRRRWTDTWLEKRARDPEAETAPPSR